MVANQYPCRYFGNVPDTITAIKANAYPTPVTFVLGNVGDRIVIRKGYTLLPSMMAKLGVGVDTEIQPTHQLGVHLELSSLLVPPFPSQAEREQDPNIMDTSRTESVWAGIGRNGAELLREYDRGSVQSTAIKICCMHELAIAIRIKCEGEGWGLLARQRIYKKIGLDLSYFIARNSSSPLNNNTIRLCGL